MAAQRAQQKLVIDGVLNDAEWQTCTWQSDFTQFEPHNGEPATENTRFCVKFDDENIYVGIDLTESDPKNNQEILTRRDGFPHDDRVFITIDSLFDRRSTFEFGLNAAGVHMDCFGSGDGNAEDCNWDAVWAGGARRYTTGWHAEFAIPFSQLRFSRGQQTWGLQVIRTVADKSERSVWSPWKKQCSGFVSWFGTLDNIDTQHVSRALEIIPYGLLGGRFDANDNKFLYAVGADARYAITNDFSLSLSANPDFGQVEADPATVNLTAQEIFFAEKRRFFLEGAEFFRLKIANGGTDSLFYSRRIGAPPHGDTDGAKTFEIPQSTTIYGAAKLSGKTSSGWAVAALEAVTGEERLKINGKTTTVEPLTNYTILSVGKDFRDGKSNVLGMLSGVQRKLDGTGMRDELKNQAYSGGLQLDHRFWDDMWSTDVSFASTAIYGSKLAIQDTQKSSVHYFQRPDAKYLNYDPKRTNLYGHNFHYSVGKTGGTIRYAVGGDIRSPGFESNDLGFQTTSDFIGEWLWLHYRDEIPGTLLRSWRTNLNGWLTHDFGGLWLNAGGNVDATITFINQWSAQTIVGAEQIGWDTGLLRGGPAMRSTPYAFGIVNIQSNPARSVRGSLAAHLHSRFTSDTRSANISGTLTFQALSNLDLSLGPNITFTRRDVQYVDTINDTGGTPHYVLAHLEQTTISLTLRANYAFSPHLSLQVYAQPFTSSGRYTQYKDVTRPKAKRYSDRFERLRASMLTRDADTVYVDSDGNGISDFNFSDPDFSVRDFRSNVVLRWEYLSGSALFLVWTHFRSMEGSNGGYDFSRHMINLGDETGEHLVMLKASYWFDL